MIWEQVKNVREFDPDLALVKRYFAPLGKKWPRVCIATYRYRDDGGVIVGLSRKEGPGRWWQAAPLPVELLQVLLEVVSETQSKLDPTATRGSK